MKKPDDRSYEAFREEFCLLRESGVRLYFPEGTEIMPDVLAETISHDPDATYMRDAEYDRKGRMVRINFTRVRL
ncbi:MAG: hypothetical protein Q4B09_03510 [Lachnospiraceae bacterium]|nr:hypothetical protein [Lachnospiraceae bacterium]